MVEPDGIAATIPATTRSSSSSTPFGALIFLAVMGVFLSAALRVDPSTPTGDGRSVCTERAVELERTQGPEIGGIELCTSCGACFAEALPKATSRAGVY